MNKKVLCSLTSLGDTNWDRKLDELDKFGINEFALFVTTLSDPAERQTIYKKISDRLPDARIPFCHIRQQDMSPSELDFLIEKFGTKLFNIHTVAEYAFGYDYSKYMGQILVENSGPSNTYGLRDEDLQDFGGICLDISHLENARLQDLPGYKVTLSALEKYPVRANHISAITKKLNIYGVSSDKKSHDSHFFTNLTEFDYLKKYPDKYFGQYMALELTNSITEQLEVKKYIEKILGDKLNQNN